MVPEPLFLEPLVQENLQPDNPNESLSLEFPIPMTINDFVRIDTDHDGLVTFAELAQNPVDMDSDGVVTATEWLDFSMIPTSDGRGVTITSSDKFHDFVSRFRLQLQVGDNATELLRGNDVDGDKSLSQAECLGISSQLFAQFDSNSDGVLAGQEVQPFAHADVSLFYKNDLDHDRLLTPEELGLDVRAYLSLAAREFPINSTGNHILTSESPPPPPPPPPPNDLMVLEMEPVLQTSFVELNQLAPDPLAPWPGCSRISTPFPLPTAQGFLSLSQAWTLDILKTVPGGEAMFDSDVAPEPSRRDSKSIRFKKTIAGQAPNLWFGAYVPVLGGFTYEISAFVKFNLVATPTNFFGIRVINSVGYGGKTMNDWFGRVAPNTWTKISTTWTAINDASELVHFLFDNAPQSFEVRFHDLAVHQISCTEFNSFSVDPLTPYLLIKSYLNAGLNWCIARSRNQNRPCPELYTLGRKGQNLGTDILYVPGATAFFSDSELTDAPHRDVRSIYFKKTGSGYVSGLWFGVDVPVTAGVTYRLSAWMKFLGTVPMPAAALGFRVHYSVDGIRDFSDFLSLAQPGQWIRATGSWTASKTVQELALLIFDAAPQSMEVYFHDLAVEEIRSGTVFSLCLWFALLHV